MTVATSPQTRHDVLVAIPVFNEQRYIRGVLDRVGAYPVDVLVIDDGSTDQTPRLLAERADLHSIRHEGNRGYGRSLIDAFAFAKRRGYPWVITMDCDEQHEPEMIPQFLQAIATDRWDLISGSRYLVPQKDDDLPPGDRRRINGLITQRVNDALGLRLTDAFCGFKAHRVDATVRLRLDEDGYAFPLQLWPRAARAGLRIHEIPVRLIYNDPTRHFGGMLDDADRRLAHYLGVFDRELAAPARPVACCCCD